MCLFQQESSFSPKPKKTLQASPYHETFLNKVRTHAINSICKDLFYSHYFPSYVEIEYIFVLFPKVKGSVIRWKKACEKCGFYDDVTVAEWKRSCIDLHTSANLTIVDNEALERSQ